MPRALFLILLTLGSTLPTRAEEIGLCAKTCVAERSRCQRDARALDQAERAAWAYHRQDVRMGSDASAEMERLEARRADADKRRSERDADCVATHSRCSADCRPGG